MTTESSKRCFIGFAIEAEARLLLTEAQQTLSQLPAHAATRMRLSMPADLHVTLRFLGNVTQKQMPNLIDVIAHLAQTHPMPAGLHIEGASAFPLVTRPRIVFANVHTHGSELPDLVRDLENAVQQLGFTPEPHEFKAHVTLARVEGAAIAGPLTHWIVQQAQRSFGNVNTREIVLFESVGGKRDTVSRYVPIHAEPCASKVLR